MSVGISVESLSGCAWNWWCASQRGIRTGQHQHPLRSVRRAQIRDANLTADESASGYTMALIKHAMVSALAGLREPGPSNKYVELSVLK